MPLTFVTGPVRSGKSRLAHKLARDAAARGCRITFVATAARIDGDAEWDERIERHRLERDASWRVIETALPGAPSLIDLARDSARDQLLLVDSTGTWLAARFDDLIAEGAPLEAFERLDAEAQAVVEALAFAAADVIVVGDEVGWGIVPEHRSARLFRDCLGRMHQALTAASDRAYLTVAGRAIDLRAASAPI